MFNIELIRSTKTLLFDLIELSKRDIYKESYITGRIKEIHSNLDKLNTLDSAYREEQDKKVSQIGASMTEEDSSFEGFMVTQIVRESLDDFMLVHYSDERKRWIKRHQIIFFLPKWFRKSIYFSISSLATIMIEKLLPVLIEGLLDYYVSILAGLIIYLTLDKYFENVFERYFWKSIKPHIVALLNQFNEYLNHLQIFLKNKGK